MQSKDGKDKCQPYRCSILSENYNGEPIALERKIFPGTTASELLQNSKTPWRTTHQIWKFHWSNNLHVHVQRHRFGQERDSCIINSRKNQNICVKIHWQTLGVLGFRRRKQVVSRIGSELWQMGTPCFTNCGGIREFLETRYSKEQVRWVAEDWKWEVVEILSTSMESVTTLIFFSEPSMQRISSVFTEQSHSCVESSQRQTPERQVKADQKVLEEHPEKFRSSRKNGSHWLIFRDYRLLRKTECFRTWKIPNRCPSWKITPSNRDGKLFCYDSSWRWRMGKTHANVQRLHSAQKSEGFKTIRIDRCKPKRRSNLECWNWLDCWCSRHWGASTITEWSVALDLDFENSW